MEANFAPLKKQERKGATRVFASLTLGTVDQGFDNWCRR